VTHAPVTRQAPVAIEGRIGRVTISLPADLVFRGALRLLVGGIGSRSQLTYEQIDELQLAVEAAVALRTVAAETLVVEADLAGNTLVLVLGPFLHEDDAAERPLLDRLVRRATVTHREDGAEWIVLDVGGRDGAERES
jgi:hypothetical protein